MKIEDVHKTVVEVEKLIAGILVQLNTTLDTLNDSHRETGRDLNEVRLQCEKEFVALKKDIDELQRWSEKHAISDLKSQVEVLKEKVIKLEAALDKFGTRAWSLTPNVAGAIVNVLLAAVVALIVSKLAK